MNERHRQWQCVFLSSVKSARRIPFDKYKGVESGTKSNLITSNHLKYSFFVGETTTAHQALSSFWGKKGGNIAYGVGKKSRLSNYQCTVNHLSNMCELFVSLFEAAFNNWAAQQGTAKVIGTKYHKHLP